MFQTENWANLQYLMKAPISLVTTIAIDLESPDTDRVDRFEHVMKCTVLPDIPSSDIAENKRDYTCTISEL